MKKKFKFLFLFYWMCFGAIAQSGKLFSVDMELSNSLIYQVYQDSKGLIWIATEDGLNRYDGAKFTIYKHDPQKPHSILNNYVHRLFEDKQGHLLIGYYNGLQVYDHATDSFKKIPLLPGSGNLDAHVLSITQRQNGEILIGTSGFGVFSLSFKGGEPQIKPLHHQIPGDIIDYLYEDTQANLWVSTQDQGLLRISPTGQVQRFSSSELPQHTVTQICEGMAGQVFLSTVSHGLYLYNQPDNSFTHIPDPTSPDLSISTMHFSKKDNKLYLGTDGEGVKIYDLERKVITGGNFNVATFDFNKSKIRSILVDNAGNLWLGIYQKGVMLIPATTSNFKYIGYKSIHNNIIGSNAIMSVFEDHTGTLWIGTDSDGLYAINQQGRQQAHFKRTSDPTSVPSSIMSIYEDSNQNLWVGSFLHGLAKVNPKTGKSDYITGIRDQNGDRVNRIYSITEDRNKHLWIASMGAGLFSMDLRTDAITHYDAVSGSANTGKENNLHNRWINCLLVTSKNKLYIGTYDGIGCLDLRTKSFTSTHGTNRLLHGYIVYALFEDKEGNIWIGTSQGLLQLDGKTNKIQTFTIEDGLPSNVICAIKDDAAGNIWISTNYGIAKLNPRKKSFINYYANDGLQGNEFSKGAGFVNSRQQIIFGGISGITYFKPADIPDVIHSPGKDFKVRITGFYLHNQPVTKDLKSGNNSIINKSVMEADTFHLSHTDNSFSIELSTMDFANPERVAYLYALPNGIWNSLRPGTNTVHFTDLAPGTYHLRFRAKQYNHYSAVREITITIYPAWYFSAWAKLIYALLLLGLVLLVVLQVRHRRQIREKMQEHLHAKQMNDAKLQFFINISHEIRTPITLILNPLKKLIAHDPDQDRQKSYGTMARNTERILRLINQLMDIRKIDKGQMRLQFKETDLVRFTRDLCSVFEESSRSKNIAFNVHYPMEKVLVWVDPNHFDKAILNVLSNAFKFTPKNGTISLYLQTGTNATGFNGVEHYVEIIIADSGIGIAPDEQEKVFECFYQVQTTHNHFVEGTGIGLNLTRSILELHHGAIRVENNPDGPGCRFIMRLPLGKEHLAPQDISENYYNEPAEMLALVPVTPLLPVSSLPKAVANSNVRVLVVDDDEEIRRYICQELAPEYHMLESTNGKEALALLLTKPIDLVISDVMMPEMDGISLCRKIKTNVNINHIPIVLLTAKSEEADKLECLGIGADGFVAKPFTIGMLHITVQNLLKNRKILRNNFSGNQYQESKVQKIALKSADEKLLSKLLDIINQNLDNPGLSVEMIAGEIGISRVHLHRKVKELTNQSTRDFIRNIRLKQAADLLSSKHINISEVAFAVGFTNLAAFSTAFKELYGMPPTAYMELHTKQVENKSIL